ncbi:hypothetical protein SUGI_0031510 [Cryptomeria japonica]|uniref:expansin-like B1 n=1 Tax=Cryptomeria japonica TaxID=3369 RepID=UPI002408AD2C|nr:expansin-like B1 [Cryptomeria japonica]GLJ06082.1 hypothetical protein SUGI_0031510 [Cryptomeria japonica]
MASSSCFSALLFVLPMLILLYRGDSQLVKSRAAYYESQDGLGTSRGGCGYGEFGRELNYGDVAAVGRLFRGGAGCGACYQVKCKNEDLCSGKGVKVVATDHGEGDGTDFIMSPHAFTAMAKNGKDKHLLALGVVDIKYKRVPCQYPGYNIMFKINESSDYPYYLSLVFWYTGGQKDIIAVELSQDKILDWKAMRRSYGGVWDIAPPPCENIVVRFLVSDDYDSQWVSAPNVIPANWKAGSLYDSGIQIN